MSMGTFEEILLAAACATSGFFAAKVIGHNKKTRNKKRMKTYSPSREESRWVPSDAETAPTHDGQDEDSHEEASHGDHPPLVLRANPLAREFGSSPDRNSPTPFAIGDGTAVSLLKDADEIERELGRQYGHFFKPFRLMKAIHIDRPRPILRYVEFIDRQDILRYRSWSPPAIVFRNSQGQPRSKTVQMLNDPPGETKTPGDIEIIISPAAMDTLLTRIVPISDPRYYRVYKELSFSLCQRLASKMKIYIREMNGSYDDFRVFLIHFDGEGNVVSKKFEERISETDEDDVILAPNVQALKDPEFYRRGKISSPKKLV